MRFENAVAVMLRKQVHHLVDTRGCEAGLHHIRTKDGAEVDFSLSVEGSLTHLVECKLVNSSPHHALSRFALQFPEAMAPADALPPWRPLLRGARQREGRSPMARWLQLATLAADGTPRVRTLVFRGWGGPAALDLLTDGRSAKATELRSQPAVELCWLLPRARCQFRLRGAAVDLPLEQAAAERQRHWQALTPEGRALWGWPPPGQPLEPSAAFPAALSADTPLPEAFVLLRIALEQVELLELAGQPHRRRRWRADAGWLEEPLNP